MLRKEKTKKILNKFEKSMSRIFILIGMWYISALSGFGMFWAIRLINNEIPVFFSMFVALLCSAWTQTLFSDEVTKLGVEQCKK
jgi:hypothetical protein